MSGTNPSPALEVLVRSSEPRISAPPPPVVGAYWIGEHLAISLTRRPHRLARLLCRWLLDWRWKDV